MYKDQIKSIERTAAGALKLGVLLAFLDILFVSKNVLMPFVFGKMTAFRIIVAVMIFFYVVLLYCDKERYKPRIAPIGFMLLVFAGAMILTMFMGVDLANSFWGSIERMGGLYNYLFYIAFFVMLSGLLSDPKEWDRLMVLSVCVGAAVAFYGMGQMLWPGNYFLGNIVDGAMRPTGTTGNALFFGTYLLWNFFFFGYVLYRYRKLWQRLVFGGLFVYTCVMFFAAQVRGAFVGLFAGVFVMAALLAVLSRSKKVRMASLAAILLAVVVVGGLFMFRDHPTVKNNRYLNRFSDISLETGTMRTRLLAWSSGFAGFLERPVFGYGTENYVYAFDRHYRPEFYGGVGSETFDRPHNIPLEVLVETGIVGSAAYIGLWGMTALFLLKQAYKKRDELIKYAILFGALVAYHVQSLVSIGDFTGYIVLFFFLGYVNYLQYSETKGAGTIKESVSVPSTSEEQGDPNYVVLGVVGMLAVFLFILVDVPAVYQVYYGAKAEDARMSDKPEEGTLMYREAFSYNSPIGETEMAGHLALFAMREASWGQKGSRVAGEALLYAMEMEERVVKKHPMDLGARINLGRLYNIYAGYSDEPLSYYKKAEAVELEALDLSPFREQVYFELGQTYVLMGDFEKGSHYYKLALELAPTIAVSNYYYGMSLYSWSKGLKAQGDVDAATEKLNEAVAYIDKAVAHNYLFLASVGDLKNISNVYLEAERYDSMAVALTELLKRNPKDMAIVAQLAMAYKAAGNNEKAREAAEIMRRASDRPEDIQWTEAFLRTVQ